MRTEFDGLPGMYSKPLVVSIAVSAKNCCIFKTSFGNPFRFGRVVVSGLR